MINDIPLLFSAFLTGCVGFFSLIFVRKGRYKLTFRDGNCIVVLAWSLSCLFGMLPFLFYGREFTLINALFESVSGFTTTGASILNDIEALPRGLQFWRISTAWVGGIGIVTLFSMITVGRDKSTLSGACIGNVGPGFGDVGSMSNYAAFPGILKVTGMLEMLIGRLEIFPVLYLLRSFRNH